ncbi:MAG: Cof-type HAD-IIB family hydrolase [Patescibacteria group bacterium]|nr:Cof-type HAD-IIB family hydrolase [Patescibacteria group bacterium]
MKYKSLLLDVDGTIVPVGPYTVPSEKVTDSIKKAKKEVFVSIVSGRPLNWLTETFKTLELTSPCIINGGSQIVDPQSGDILWEKPIAGGDMDSLMKIIKYYKTPFIVNDGGIEYKNPSVLKFEKPLAVQMSYFNSKEESDECLRTFEHMPGVSAHKFFSWDKDRNYKMEVYVTQAEATKQYATQELAKMLKVQASEMIGIGDSRNDMPFLNACGLKVAMENADDKLKAVAHYIAPSVDKDGVAHVIEKFIFS